MYRQAFAAPDAARSRDRSGDRNLIDAPLCVGHTVMDESLIGKLRSIAEARCAGNGPAHDFLHVLRVAELAQRIGRVEGADLGVVVPAALLHELFNYPKGHPQSQDSGEVCARHAEEVLRDSDCPPHLIKPVGDCIRIHAFSLGLTPETIEGKVLQDADRLDAIGAIGIARCFATCTEMGVPFYNPADPFWISREADDRRWGLDHFERKLLRIPDRLHTRAARSLAKDRLRMMEAFLAQLKREIEHADPLFTESFAG
jgi:uncharacterized protein